MRKQLATALLGTMIATSAQAWQAGDMLLRAGAAGVYPTGDGSALGTTVEADDAWSLGISFTYMATNSIGVGVLGAWPFDHDITAAGAGTVGDTKHLPPTVTLQYHFDTGSNLHPYVGAGVNYTHFFDEGTTGVLSGASLELDDSWGLAAELGLDYELQNDWTVGGQIFYVDIDTEASVNGGPKFDVEIDPWVYMVSVGKKF